MTIIILGIFSVFVSGTMNNHCANKQKKSVCEMKWIFKKTGSRIKKCFIGWMFIANLWMDGCYVKEWKWPWKEKKKKIKQNGPLNKWQILFLLTTTICCCCCWRFWPQKQQQQKCGQIINWEIIFRQTKKSDTFNNESFIIHVFFLFAFFFVVLTDNFRPIKSIYIWIIHMHFLHSFFFA